MPITLPIKPGRGAALLAEGRDVTKRWLQEKGRSLGLPGVVIAGLILLLKRPVSQLTAEQAPLIVVTICLSLLFATLTTTTLLYVIHRLLNEISRISEARDRLEMVLLEKRLSTDTAQEGSSHARR